MPTPSPSNPESLFVRYLEARAAGDAPDFDSLCRDHPALASALRQIRDDWERAQALVHAAVAKAEEDSFALRLKAKYGASVDPKVSLDAAAGPNQRATTAHTDALLERLQEHSLAHSRYRLEGEVARGGMGAILRVWDEDIRRHLAMKVILGRGEAQPIGETPDVDPRQLARFLEEAQVTGQLDHPGIVPVHELGLAADGRVYFTMKLVKGRDLRYIFDLVSDGREGWTVTRALSVLLKVCDAMAYAHAKGVIHRDLKPSNIMVGNYGEVFVMDWGVARVLGRKDTRDIRIKPEFTTSHRSVKTERGIEREQTPDSPIVTMDGDIVGTPAYMSPEQARGEIDKLGPQSDVYSVGALLYHLLAGEMPFVPKGARMSPRTILLRLIEGPPKSLSAVAPAVPAELAAICEKAMARDAQHRYPSTLALADDLRAYLEHRVVGAYKTGAIAELQKWVQRNRGLAASLLIAMAILIGGAITSMGFAVEAKANADLADARAKSADAQRTRAEQSATEATTEKVRAEHNATLAEQRLTHEQALVSLYRQLIDQLSDYKLGVAMLDELRNQIESSLKLSGQDSANSAAIVSGLDRALVYANATYAARAVLRRTVFWQAEAAIELLQPEVRSQIQGSFGDKLIALGLYDIAERLERATIVSQRTVLGDDNPAILESMSKLAVSLSGQGKLGEAEPLYREVIRRQRETVGDSDARTSKSMNYLATLLQSQGRFDKAEALYRDVLADSRRIRGDNDVQTLTLINNTAALLQAIGKYTDAETLFREVFEARLAKRGERNAETLSVMQNLANVLQSQGRSAESEKMFRTALNRCRESLGDSHEYTLKAMINLAVVFQARNSSAEAESLAREAQIRSRDERGPYDLLTLISTNTLGRVFKSQGRFSEAEPLFRESLEGLCQTLGVDNRNTINALSNLGTWLRDAGRLADAEPILWQVLTINRALEGDDGIDTLRSLHSLGKLFHAQARLGDAEYFCRQALAGRRAFLGDDHPDTLAAIHDLAVTLESQGELEEAEALYREALAGRLRKLEDGHPETCASSDAVMRLVANRRR
jgi:tetratricopeptide (TPR) repeat protein